MSGLRVDISIDDRQIRRAFNTLLNAAEHPRPILESVGHALTGLVDLEFRESKDPYGHSWAPLTSRHGQPLRDTGRMANSVAYRVEGNAVEVGLGFRYAPTHQFGATIRPVRARKLRFMIGGRVVFADKSVIPARPILPLNGLPSTWRNEITETIRFYLDRLIA